MPVPSIEEENSASQSQEVQAFFSSATTEEALPVV